MKSQDVEKEIERLTKALKSPHITNTTNPIDFPKSRTEQLADECWVHTKEPLFSSKSPHWEFDRHKFAELIVRECLSMIENEAAQYHEPVWAVELVNDIKETFGVN